MSLKPSASNIPPTESLSLQTNISSAMQADGNICLMDSTRQSSLAQRMWDYTKREFMTDAFLYSSDRERIPAHLSVLATVSPVLQTYAETFIVENHPRDIKLLLYIDVPGYILKAFLAFAYMGQLDFNKCDGQFVYGLLKCLRLEALQYSLLERCKDIDKDHCVTIERQDFSFQLGIQESEYNPADKRNTHVARAGKEGGGGTPVKNELSDDISKGDDVDTCSNDEGMNTTPPRNDRNMRTRPCKVMLEQLEKPVTRSEGTEYMHREMTSFPKGHKCDKCNQILCVHRIRPLLPEELEQHIREEGSILLDPRSKEPVTVTCADPNIESKDFSDLCAEEFVTKLENYARLVKFKSGALKTINGCPFCGYYFINFSKVMRHITVHVELKRMLCVFCDKSFVSHEGLSVHDRDCHGRQGKSGVPGGAFKCKKCQVAYSTEKQLQRHQENHRNDILEWKKENTELNKSKALSFTYEWNPATKRKKKVWPCPYCPFTARSEPILRAHVSRHTGINSFPCDMCDKVLRSGQSLKQHINNIHKTSNVTVKMEQVQMHADIVSILEPSEVGTSIKAEIDDYDKDQDEDIVGFDDLNDESDYDNDGGSPNPPSSMHHPPDFEDKGPEDRTRKSSRRKSKRKRHPAEGWLAEEVSQHSKKRKKLAAPVKTASPFKADLSEKTFASNCRVCEEELCVHRVSPMSPEEMQQYIERQSCKFLDPKTMEETQVKFGPDPPAKPSKYAKMKTSDIVEYLQEHATTVKFNDESTKTIFCCPFCCVFYMGFSKLMRHIGVHVDMRRIECVYCNHKFNCMETYIRHDKDRHGRKGIKGVEGGMFKCERCDSGYETAEQLRRHTNNHVNDMHLWMKEHNFGKARKLSFLYKWNPQTHRMVKTWPCPHCPFKGKTECLTLNHIPVHTGVGSFKCDECDKVFKAYASLTKYKRLHMKPTSSKERFTGYHNAKTEAQDRAIYEANVFGQGNKCNHCNRRVCHHRTRFLSTTDLDKFQRIEGGVVEDHEMKLKQENEAGIENATQEDMYKVGNVSIKCKRKTVFDKTGYCADIYLCEMCNIYLIGKDRLSEHIEAHNYNTVSAKYPCPFCPAQLTKNHYYEHGKRHHEDKLRLGCPSGEYKCAQCKLTFENAEQLNRHQEYHRTKKTTCSFPDSNNYPTKLEKDRKTKKTKLVYHCHECTSTFKNIPELVAHYSLHKSNFECEDCGEKFSFFKPLAIHRKRGCLKLAVQGQSKDDRVKPDGKCEICNTKICIHTNSGITNEELQHHISHEGSKLIHPKTKKRVSTVPGVDSSANADEYATLSTEEFATRLLANSFMVKFPSGKHKTVFGCPFCARYFWSFNKIISHITIHVKMERIQCIFCDKKFTTKDTYSIHDRKKHGGRGKRGIPGGQYPCSRCCLVYETDEQLKRHIENHENDIGEWKKDHSETALSWTLSYRYEWNPRTKRMKKVWPCPHCPFVTTYEPDLQGHVSKHTGIPHFKCDQCNKQFRMLESLRKHQEFHKGVKYVCKICGQLFKSKETMMRHEQHVHTDSFNYSCEVCGKSYKHKYSVTEHMIHAHANHTLPDGETSDWQCSQCGKFLPSENMMKIHLRLHGDGGKVIKKFKCRVCDEHFQYRTNRISHEKNIHKVKIESRPSSKMKSAIVFKQPIPGPAAVSVPPPAAAEASSAAVGLNMPQQATFEMNAPLQVPFGNPPLYDMNHVNQANQIEWMNQ